MLRKGVILAVMLLFIGLSIIPSTGNLVEGSGLSLIIIKAFEEMGENGWCVSDVPVIITSKSDEIAEFYYRISGGSWTEYTEPFNISVDGDDIPLGWYAVDYAGNQSEVDRFTFDIDQTPPDIEEITWEAFEDPPYSGHWYVTFTCDATDATSGMDRVEMFINDEWHETVTGPGPVYQFTIKWSEAFNAVTWWFYHYDKAGNMVADDIPGYCDIDSINSYIPSMFVGGIVHNLVFYPAPSNLKSSLFSMGIVEEDSHQSSQSIVPTSESVVREQYQSDCSISGDFDPSYIIIVVERRIGDNGWFVSNVNISIIPKPDNIIAVYYRLDSGDWTLYTEALGISEDGIHSFSCYVIDMEGYSSAPDSISFKIDQTPPEIILTKKRMFIGQVKFKANVYDKTSNINRVEFGDRYDVYFTDYDFPYEWIWTLIPLKEYKHFNNPNVKATVYDNAGNSNSSLKNALNIPCQSNNWQSNNMWFLRWLDRFPRMFPILRQLLGL